MKRNKVEYWDDEVEEFKGKPKILPPAPKEEKTVNVNFDHTTHLSKSEEAKWNRFFLIIIAIWLVGLTIAVPAFFIYLFFFM